MFMVIGCKIVKALLCKFWNYYRNWGWVGYFIESNLPMVKWLVDRLWFIILGLIYTFIRYFKLKCVTSESETLLCMRPPQLRYNYLPISIHSLVSKYIDPQFGNIKIDHPNKSMLFWRLCIISFFILIIVKDICNEYYLALNLFL